jgi:hypothetical protein
LALHDRICTSAFTGRQRRAGPYYTAADEELLPLIRRVADDRPTYGYLTALVNRVLAAEGKPAANHKGVFRIMKRQGLLLQRHTGRRKGRLHDGKVVVMRSNLRWCSASSRSPAGMERSCASSSSSMPTTGK